MPKPPPRPSNAPSTPAAIAIANNTRDSSTLVTHYTLTVVRTTVLLMSSRVVPGALVPQVPTRWAKMGSRSRQDNDPQLALPTDLVAAAC